MEAARPFPWEAPRRVGPRGLRKRRGRRAGGTAWSDSSSRQHRVVSPAVVQIRLRGERPMIFPARLPSLLDGGPRDVDVLDPVAVQQRGQRTLAYAALLAIDHVLAEEGEPLRPEVALPAEVPGSHLGASHVHAVRGLDLRPCEVEGVHELVGEDSSELEGRP
eukprot:CAMPEP_0177358426 /NCGR_PEP_ID=MMETSP0368-20130122/35578_1 /TAXON_ID=447022 ORGANISM="Scrippsiella hangoei-like, Strain SHHI-4" /NCGR_SAMPLE_ID=MMETSP0368 /ASSEMBLY_ACC=CAM_ASM_000363 /LENGTH=162 /DNA_ID=CAMNT_0018820875 /DNA_START=78 /DNA_END=566 /DNA_ORIENTATION=+